MLKTAALLLMMLVLAAVAGCGAADELTPRTSSPAPTSAPSGVNEERRYIHDLNTYIAELGRVLRQLNAVAQNPPYDDRDMAVLRDVEDSIRNTESIYMKKVPPPRLARVHRLWLATLGHYGDAAEQLRLSSSASGAQAQAANSAVVAAIARGERTFAQVKSELNTLTSN